MKFKSVSKIFLTAFVTAAALTPGPAARGEYADQLKAQVKQIESEYAPGAESAYFRNMGIIARKADDSQNYELLALIIKNSLFAKMEFYINEQLKTINELLETDPFAAGKKITALLNTQRYYEPSADYLETSDGKSFAGELARQRQEGAQLLKKNQSVDIVVKGLYAYQKTGLFSIKGKQQETDLNELHKQIGCALGWRKKLSLKTKQKFRTDYESGTVEESMELTLQTPASDYASAEWRGSWIYTYKGRDGEGQGVSEAILKLQRGQYETEILITAARLSSSGRFNFPVNLSPVKRLVSVKPPHLLPRAELFEQTFSLTGGEDEGAGLPAKVQSKTGRVLLG